MTKYKALIGIEMHCEITSTNSKVFSPAKNSYEVNPNVNIMPIDMGFPGTLPVVNKEAVRKALMMSIILGCKQPEYLYFERKNYYYPDLPKGYQITQETKPAPVGIYGEMEYICNGEKKIAKINNLHLEEDSASMEHFADVSLIDYNRSGVPLLELVTEPCFHSSDEVVAFLETIRSIYRYTGISEADSKKGQIRCDVNISIMDEDKDESDYKNYGTKVETKNVNSFSAVREVIDYEIQRQIKLKEDGKYDEMPQQTRRWDEAAGETKFMRSKADAIDYKYFIEPNIPKFKITEKFLLDIKKEIPMLADERKEKYITEYNLKEYDANIIVKDKDVSDYFEELIKNGVDAKEAANWINTVILGTLNKLYIKMEDFNISPKKLAEVIKMISDGKISRNQGKDAISASIEENKDPLVIIEERGFSQIDNDGEIEALIEKVILDHPKEVEEIKNGRDNKINFLLGLIMKETKGKANPAKTMKMLREKMDL